MASSLRFRFAACAVVLAASAVTVYSSDAVAQPSVADKETARSLLDRGEQKLAAKDFVGAERDFAAAHELVKVPTTGIRLGKAQEKNGKLLEARDVWLWVARFPQKPGESPAFGEARTEAAALAKAIAPRIPALVIQVQAPEGVEPVVEIDGKPVPAAALSLPRKVNPGQRVVAVSAPGFDRVEGKVSVKEGETRTVSIEMKAKAGGAGGEATVSGSGDTLPDPPPDDGAARPYDSGADSGGSSALMIVGFTVAGLGFAVGSVTGLMSLSAASDAKEHCEGSTCRPVAQDDIDRSESLATVSNIGFGVGLVGLGIGIWQLVSQPSGSAQASRRSTWKVGGLRVQPILGLTSAGVRGSF